MWVTESPLGGILGWINSKHHNLEPFRILANIIQNKDNIYLSIKMAFKYLHYCTLISDIEICSETLCKQAFYYTLVPAFAVI